MGNRCSHIIDYWAHLATEAEVKDAAKSIEAWQKAQEQNRATGGAQHATGALLYRVGGPDTVKRVVEVFFRKLYSNERLLVFLHDKDPVTLRAKQSAFMSWLFGPSNQSYSGRNLRLAHLRIIKQRGFTPEDFDVGLNYFVESMREMGAPEAIVNEVMDKLRPFKDIVFLPSARDAEEEARWAKEELQAREDQPLLQHQPAETGGLVSPAAGSRPASGRVAQCPFTGGRLSRPATASTAASATAVVAVLPTSASPEMQQAPSPSRPSTPLLAAMAPASTSASTSHATGLGPNAAPMAAAPAGSPASPGLSTATYKAPSGGGATDAAAAAGSAAVVAARPSSRGGATSSRPPSAGGAGLGVSIAAATAVAMPAAAVGPPAAAAVLPTVRPCSSSRGAVTNWPTSAMHLPASAAAAPVVAMPPAVMVTPAIAAPPPPPAAMAAPLPPPPVVAAPPPPPAVAPPPLPAAPNAAGSVTAAAVAIVDAFMTEEFPAAEDDIMAAALAELAVAASSIAGRSSTGGAKISVSGAAAADASRRSSVAGMLRVEPGASAPTIPSQPVGRVC